MGRISDLVSRGVRVVAGEGPDVAAQEIPADFFFESGEAKHLGRSELGADIAEARLPEPFRGYGIDKLSEILDSKRLATLPREVKIAAVLASLDAAGVSVGQVVRDAVLRDRALDDFLAAKERAAEALRARNEARIQALRQEVEDFVRERNTEIEGLTSSSEGSSSAFAKLQLRKRQEEERLREVLAHFVEPAQNPIPAPGVNGSRKPAKGPEA
jgi:hypothetical protein